MEELLLRLLQEYGYIILFVWSIMEGELGLIMAGIMAYAGQMHWGGAVLVAALGGFTGDQLYFYVGRSCRRFIHRKMRTQRRKFALAHLLLKRYGWPLVFVQRYLYGMRTVIPMAIGLTRFSARKFAIINFCSALVWSYLTISLAYLFGQELLLIVHWTKAHFYLALPLAGAIAGCFYLLMRRATRRAADRPGARKGGASRKIPGIPSR